MRPFALQPLFNGGTFDASYNLLDTHRPVQFATPEGTQMGLLHAFITGIGAPLMPEAAAGVIGTANAE